MNSPEISCITQLGKDLPILCDLMSKAFFHTPSFQFVIPDVTQRTAHSNSVFQMILRFGMKCEEIYVNSEKSGIAVLYAPDRVLPTTWDLIKCGGFKCVRKLGFSFLKRQALISEYSDALHQKYAPFPHWYLSMLAVRPALQQRGLGSSLLRHIQTIMSKRNLPVYLFTSDGANVPFTREINSKCVKKWTCQRQICDYGSSCGSPLRAIGIHFRVDKGNNTPKHLELLEFAPL